MMSKNLNNQIFPIEIFPEKILKIINELHNSMNFNLEYLSSAMLSATSLAIGNTYRIKFIGNWIEKANLYMVIVGNSGDGKSHPISFAFKPIMDEDINRYKDYKSALKNYNDIKGEKESGIEKPKYVKFILRDFTPESLIEKHKYNERGITILADELSGWIKNFNRYNKSGEQETYLTMWSGQPISIDRKSEDTTLIESPFVNIIGGLQTKILKDLVKDNRGENGFIERILFVLSDTSKIPDWKDVEMDRNVLEQYNFYIQRLFTLDFIDYQPRTIEFTDESKELLIQWRNNFRSEFSDERSTSILAKYEIYVLRFSLIIQLMFWATDNKTNQKVELFAVKKAIILVEYFFHNAKKVHNILFDYNPIQKLDAKEKLIFEELENNFTTNSALKLAEKHNMEKRTLYRFLENREIFLKSMRGMYSKNI